jgi:hypothetical protein
MEQRHRVFVFAALALSSSLLAGCGGGDDPPAAANAATDANRPAGAEPTAGANPPAGSNDPAADNDAPASGGSNSAPQITGTPIVSVLPGAAYVFAPSATDDDGNRLTFSIANLPPWATFDSSTGQLTGTPTAANVGSYHDITISVSDGSASASLAAFDLQVVATAMGSTTLSWTPPTQNTDGSPLNDLAGYKVYWGTSQDDYSNSVTIANPGLATYVVNQLTPARWYFVVTAYSAAGLESGYSNAFTKTIQ